MNKRISIQIFVYSCVVFVVGFSSLFVQSLLIRELLVVFSAYEIAVGMILCGWLIWMGLGSILYRTITRKIKNKQIVLVYSLCAYICAMFFEIFLIKDIRPMLGIAPGEIIGVHVMFLISFCALLPFAFINGFLFSLCVDLHSGRLGSRSTSFVYSLDALADLFGGVVFAFFFVFLFKPIINIYIISLVNVLLVLYLISSFKIKKGHRFFVYLLSISVLLLGLYVQKVDTLLSKREWQDAAIVASRSTRYGTLHLIQQEDVYTLFENGLLSFSLGDELVPQEAVHFALLQTPRVRRVLIIGHAVGGYLQEILKYPVNEVYYLELDSELIRFILPYVSAEGRKALYDERVKVLPVDARTFLQHAPKGKFDVVLLATRAPYTAYLNRLYTYDFFVKIKNILSKEGIISFGIPSKEDYLTKALRNFNASMYHTVKSVFAAVVFMPGDTLRFVASDSDNFITDDASTLSQRFTQRNIKATFVDKYYFASKLLPWHIGYVKEALKSHKNVRLNHDFLPITYYYGMGVFSSYFYPFANNVYSRLAAINPLWYIGSFAFFWFVIVARKRTSCFSLGVFSMGACGMASVVFSILGYQILYGYVYHKVGFISACFMFGAAIGAAIINRTLRRATVRGLAYMYCLGAAYLFFLPHVFTLLEKLPSQMEWVFFLLPLGMGVIVGFSFPAALYSLHRLQKKDEIRTVGVLYACDLAGGGCCGIFLSVLAIPLYGFFISSGIISWLAVLSAIGVLAGSYGTGKQ